MRLHILGSGAGGGVPQWNCRCPICTRARAGDPKVRPRTQSSIAVSADDARVLLINASPDLRQQLAATPALHPREGLRHSPIGAVLVTNADVDHIAGLLTLREQQPFTLFAARQTLDALAANGIFDVLDATLVPRREVALDAPFAPLAGLMVTLFAVPGKVALWQEGEVPAGAPLVGAATGTTVGVLLDGNGGRVAYVPGCAEVTDDVRRRVAGADALLFDGTVFSDDDMLRAGVGAKTGRRMGHVPMTGDGGSLAALAAVPVGRRVFVHINNTNPVLMEDSPEHAAVRAAGWEVGHDGMEIETGNAMEVAS